MFFGILKGGLVFILGALLLISLLIGNLFLVLNISITPENIEEGIVSESDKIIESVGEEEIEKAIEENLPALETYCETHDEFILSQDNYTIDIPCETVAEGKDAIIEEGISDVVDEVYTKEYSCESFFDCAFESPTYLISKEAKQKWGKVFYFSIITSLILIGILFFLVSTSNLFIITGVLVTISSIPFAIFDKAFPLLDNSFLQIIPVILSGAYNVFIITLSIGLVLIGIGVGIKFFNLGGFVARLFGK
jgi:hypothetical protein